MPSANSIAFSFRFILNMIYSASLSWIIVVKKYSLLLLSVWRGMYYFTFTLILCKNFASFIVVSFFVVSAFFFWTFCYRFLGLKFNTHLKILCGSQVTWNNQVEARGLVFALTASRKIISRTMTQYCCPAQKWRVIIPRALNTQTPA